MHEIACIFIVVPQQKWNNTYAGTLYKLEGGVQTFVFKMKSRLILKTSHRVLEFLSSFKWCFFNYAKTSWNLLFYLFISLYLLSIWNYLFTQKVHYIASTVTTEITDVNSITEQKIESLSKTYLESMWTKWQIHTFDYTLIKETLKGTPLFKCSDFSGVHCINHTCRYILQSLHERCNITHFLIFLLNILKDCDNLMSLGTRSHILGPRNEMDSVPCLAEFTRCLCNVSFWGKLYGRETGTNK